MIKILNIVKYYEPSQGGMESVVKDIVEGVNSIALDTSFTVYSNSHTNSHKTEIRHKDERITIVKEATPFYFKSQPLSLGYKSLKRLISENDVIHHHYPFPTMEMALLLLSGRFKNKRLVVTWHANIKNSRWKWIQSFYNPLIKRLLNRADKIIVTSPKLFEASDILKDYGNKVAVIPLSFNPKYETSESKKFPENREFELLFVGRFRLYKGLEFLLKAIENLPVKLTLVGSGEEQAALESIADNLKIKDKLRILNNVSDEDLHTIYRNSDLFILPSINEAEAFGVVQLEAMANALPVINTNLESGVPFVSLDGESGFTVEPKNAFALREAINKIITNKELYELLSHNALKRIQLFSRSTMCNSYLEVYKND